MSTNGTIERGTIYTLGYAHPQGGATLERLMRDPRVLLLDVRYQPVSCWHPEWNRAALACRYGERYVWDERLGNVNYRSRSLPIQLAPGCQDAIIEAAVLLCEGTSLVLLCACSDGRTCQRRYVAKLIQDTLLAPAMAREVWA